MMYELTPNGTQKSFYGKALVRVNDDLSRTLYSYGTMIITIERNADYITKHWDGWTATTGKHIKAFCGLDKKAFSALPFNETVYRG